MNEVRRELLTAMMNSGSVEHFRSLQPQAYQRIESMTFFLWWETLHKIGYKEGQNPLLLGKEYRWKNVEFSYYKEIKDMPVHAELWYGPLYIATIELEDLVKHAGAQLVVDSEEIVARYMLDELDIPSGEVE